MCVFISVSEFLSSIHFLTGVFYIGNCGQITSAATGGSTISTAATNLPVLTLSAVSNYIASVLDLQVPSTSSGNGFYFIEARIIEARIFCSRL
jgi:hypothetical protein